MRRRGTTGPARFGVVNLLAHSDPIALVGIALSVALSLTLDLTGAATAVESLLAGLIGTTISLVLDASARAERRFQLRSLLQGTDWLAGAVTTATTATNEIVRRYPGSEVEAEARRRFRRLAEELDELRLGRIVRPGDDFEHLIATTHACRDRLEAVTNFASGASWWHGEAGRRYWQANLDALARGVRISRVFICDRRTDEVTALIETQRQAGVQVAVVGRRALDPAQHRNLVVWDGRRGWEARMSPHGEIVGNVFVVNEHDVDRLGAAYRACLLAARPAGG
jgi:hypothetical protein